MNSVGAGSLQGRVAVVTGASRGIGHEVAVRLASAGASVALLARTEAPNPKIAGTLSDTAAAVTAAGGQACPLPCDVRDPDAVASAVAATVEHFGAIDIVVNNAGALDLRRTDKLAPSTFRRLLQINTEGAYAVVHHALPWLRQSDNAHIVNVSPPLNLAPAWVGAHVAHTVGKYAESMLTLGWAAEFAAIPIAVNSIWPATTVASTGMIAAMGESEVLAQARSPRIMADAILALVAREAAQCSGNFYTDAEILADDGTTELSEYRLAASEDDLVANFYLASTPLPAV